MKIICGTDFSDRAGHAAHVAAKLARRFHDSVVVLHAIDLTMYSFVPETTAVVTTFQDTVESQLHSALEALSSKLAGPSLQVTAKVAYAEASQALASEGEANHARMIVVGANGARGVQRWLMGSTAERLMQNAHSPVLVVGTESTGLESWATTAVRPLRALVLVDHSPGTHAMMRWLAAFRAEVPVDLTLMHVYDLPRARDRFNMATDDKAALEHVIKEHLKKDFASLIGEDSVTWHVHALNDSFDEALESEERASNADLVVMGANQRPFFARLLVGSVSRQAVRLLNVPALCVPQGIPQQLERPSTHDFVSPSEPGISPV